MTIQPTRIWIEETTYPGHGVLFDVWGLYPNGDRDLIRQYATRLEADAYLSIDPALLTIERVRFSTTQGECRLIYAGGHVGQYGDNVQLADDGEWRGYDDAYWIAAMRSIAADVAERKPHTQTYDRLHVLALDKAAHDRTCGYWYTVDSRATAHTAFKSRAALLQWATERGLTIDGEVPDAGTRASLPVLGAFRTALHMSPTRFGTLQGEESRTMCNGDYTRAIITHDDDGLRTVHALNPNVRTRQIFNRADCAAYA